MKHGDQIGGLDLNLLLTLDALLEERNVTRTAQRLGISQPSVSAALAKLRRHFGDELLSRVGNHYELTPLAARLTVSTSAALAAIERVFWPVHQFDPASSDHQFTLIMSDYAVTVLGAEISRTLAEQAPGVRLRVESPNATTIDRAFEILQTVDGVVLPRGLLTGLPHTELFQDSWVCVVSADNKDVGDELSVDQLAEMPWVSSYYRPANYTPAAQLNMLGIEPKPQIAVGNFFGIVPLVAGTDRIALMPTRLGEMIAGSMNIKILPCPFDAVPVIEALWWDPMYRHDPAHQWLRELLAAAARALPPVPA